MEINIKDILKWIKDQDKDNIDIILEMFIRDTLKRERRMEEEKCISQMEIVMMECGKVA